MTAKFPSGGLTILLIFLAGYLLAATAIVVDGLHDRLFNADLIVVLGNKVEPNGTPSPRLRARLDRAVELYRQGRSPRIYLSGGVGKEGFDESAVMAEYLASKGVPAEALIRDSLGVDTAATAKNAAGYMTVHAFGSAIIVSQYFHIPRAKLAFRRAGIQKIGSTHARFAEARDVYSIAREVVGYVVYYLK